MPSTSSEKHRGVRLDVDTLPADDAKTFEMLGDGETIGVFQLEGSGMRRYVRELKPTEVATWPRWSPSTARGRCRTSPPTSAASTARSRSRTSHDSLEPALSDTYGIIVYQELMIAAIAIADYTGPRPTTSCDAMGKKKEDVLASTRRSSRPARRRRVSRRRSSTRSSPSSSPSPATPSTRRTPPATGLIAYQTAYLKANYPIEYMTAVLNGFRERAEKVAAVIAECRRLGIEVRPPDVQKSHALFTVETDAAGARRRDPLRPRGDQERRRGAIDAIVAVRNAGASLDRSPPSTISTAASTWTSSTAGSWSR